MMKKILEAFNNLKSQIQNPTGNKNFDILVVAEGNLREYENKIDKILKKLNEENLNLNLRKCEFAKENIIWLGFRVTPTRVTPTKH